MLDQEGDAKYEDVETYYNGGSHPERGAEWQVGSVNIYFETSCAPAEKVVQQRNLRRSQIQDLRERSELLWVRSIQLLMKGWRRVHDAPMKNGLV